MSTMVPNSIQQRLISLQYSTLISSNYRQRLVSSSMGIIIIIIIWCKACVSMAPILCVNLPPAFSLSSFSFSNTTVTLTMISGRVAAVNGKLKRLFLAHSALARGKPKRFCPPTKRDWQSPTLSSCTSFAVSRKACVRAQGLYAFACASGGTCNMRYHATCTSTGIRRNFAYRQTCATHTN